MFKFCSVCQRTFEELSDWLRETSLLADRESPTLPESRELWRNCVCGSTHLFILSTKDSGTLQVK
jgi:hypothetical protein